jgi:conjugal transfer/entry exclusion protein
MRKCLVLSVLMLLLATRAAESQLAVIDPANLTQNTISAIQDVVIAIESVLQSGYMVLELQPVDGLVTSGGISEDMATLGSIVSQAQGLSYDVGQLQSQIATLFNLDAPPSTTRALEERLLEIRRVRMESYTYAMKAQTLLMTALRTVDHLTQLISSIMDFVGHMSANQRLGEVQGTMSKTLANMQVTTTAYERAGAVDKMEEMLTAASIRAIQRRFWFGEGQ